MIRLPLYSNSNIAKLEENSNAGLWYNKFCNQWREDEWSLKSCTTGKGKNKKEINPKQDWINTVSGKKTGETRLLRDAVQRRQEMVDTLTLAGSFLVFETVTPLITGLGNPHPVENGFTWHHLFGTPFLPASSVKGLVRDWAKNWGCASSEVLDRIFGPKDKDKKKKTGSIIFLDALPTKPVQLKVEIMTPHYGDYYSSSVEQLVAPGDWLSPTPIPFLAVAESQEFQFALVSRHGGGDDKDLKMVTDWLIAALEILGAGGKTAVGYGIMTETDNSTHKRLNKANEQKRQREEKAAHEQTVREGEKFGFKGIALEIYVLAAENNWRVNNAAFYSGAEKQIPVIQQEEDLEIRKQAGRYLADMLEKTKNKGIMSDPDKKSGKKKNKNAYKQRARKIARNLLKILA